MNSQGSFRDWFTTWVTRAYREYRTFVVPAVIAYAAVFSLLISVSSVPTRFGNLETDWWSSAALAPLAFEMSLCLILIAAGILGWLSQRWPAATTDFAPDRFGRPEAAGAGRKIKTVELGGGIIFGIVAAIMTYLWITLGVAALPRWMLLLVQLGVVITGWSWVAATICLEVKRRPRGRDLARGRLALVSSVTVGVGLGGLIFLLLALEQRSE
jgi:hypothetical protein